MARSFLEPPAKKLRDFQSNYSTPSRISRSDIPRLSSLRPQTTSIASAGSVQNISLSLTQNVNIVIQGATSIAETDDNFVCATLDWRPIEKCNYNQCPRGKAGLLNLDLKKKGLINAIKGHQLSRAGMGASIEAEQYGKDIVVLKNLVKELHLDPKTQPKALSPSGYYDEKWFNSFLEVSRQEVVDGVTHHIYNLGLGDDPNMITKIQDPSYLNQVAQTYKGVSNIVNKFKPQSRAWVFKSGRALHGGAKDVSQTFANGFWYFDQLGMASTYNHKVFCSVLLWHRLMGSTVLAVTQESNQNLRVYAHCAKKKPGISIIFINLSKDSSFNVTLSNYEHQSRNLRTTNVAKPNYEFRGYQNREEYHLAALAGNIQGQIVLLNDIQMVPTKTFDIPAIEPKLVNASTPISVAAHSIVYVTIRDFQAPLCA
ncbi:heparanase-like protein 2 [Gossypium hirsutum]|uniref:Heparanase-like protein 2 n=1 Tax=Gossypium hirsutum TaxID=3635 RepID=A0A1U8I559_GOSHI|nr:heparanase-like protein 2 [Gossypium hirsutum]